MSLKTAFQEYIKICPGQVLSGSPSGRQTWFLGEAEMSVLSNLCGDEQTSLRVDSRVTEHHWTTTFLLVAVRGLFEQLEKDVQAPLFTTNKEDAINRAPSASPTSASGVRLICLLG
jgi:hypothetical protein